MQNIYVTLLDQVVPSIKKTSDLVQEISTASREQSTGLERIDAAMIQLSLMTRQSAASSEGLAATAKELGSHAKSLLDLGDVGAGVLGTC